MKSKKAPRKRRPHKLELYRRAVQHPLAEVTFLQRVYEHYSIYGAKLLREDFAGTCALSSMWVNLRDNYEAMAIEKHGPTVRWAQRTALKELGTDNIYLHIVEADVMDLYEPRVDITCALNFSTFIYHDRDELAEYFVNAYRGLKKRGIFVMDAYGGPGAMRVGTQSRHVPPENEYDEDRPGLRVSLGAAQLRRPDPPHGLPYPLHPAPTAITSRTPSATTGGSGPCPNWSKLCQNQGLEASVSGATPSIPTPAPATASTSPSKSCPPGRIGSPTSSALSEKYRLKQVHLPRNSCVNPLSDIHYWTANYWTQRSLVQEHNCADPHCFRGPG